MVGQHQLKAPSLSMGSQHLFAGGIYEEDTRPNLAKRIAGGCSRLPSLLRD